MYFCWGYVIGQLYYEGPTLLVSQQYAKFVQKQVCDHAYLDFLRFGVLFSWIIFRYFYRHVQVGSQQTLWKYECPFQHRGQMSWACTEGIQFGICFAGPNTVLRREIVQNHQFLTPDLKSVPY